MKTRWEFFFEVDGFRFERNHRFKGLLNEQNRRMLGLSADADHFIVEIELDKECKFPGAQQSGRLKILLTGDNNETKDGVRAIVTNLSHQLSFKHQGHFKVHAGLVTGERIAETDEERQQLGDAPYFAEANMAEYTPPPIFDPKSLASVNMGGSAGAAIRQFNAATQASNPIDRMIGYFKVFESLYFKRGKQNEVAVLRASEELRQVVNELANESGSTATEQDYQQLVRNLVSVRGNCAHLRANGASGFVPGTTPVASEVEPMMEIARKLAWGAIALRAKREAGNAHDPNA